MDRLAAKGGRHEEMYRIAKRRSHALVKSLIGSRMLESSCTCVRGDILAAPSLMCHNMEAVSRRYRLRHCVIAWWWESRIVVPLSLSLVALRTLNLHCHRHSFPLRRSLIKFVCYCYRSFLRFVELSKACIKVYHRKITCLIWLCENCWPGRKIQRNLRLRVSI
jgi:hypothetical protein